MALQGTFPTSDDQRVELVVPDEAAFEAMRDALRDPVWLVGATWDLLTTNDFKRGRFEDALGAWTERRTSAEIREALGDTPVSVTITS